MNYLFSALCLLVVVLANALSCQKETVNTETDARNTSLVGKWRLVESLADPGDGSGTWQKVPLEQSQLFEFRPDSSFSLTSPHGTDAGTYKTPGDNRLELRSTSSLPSTPSIAWRYLLVTPANLTLSYNCYEACGGKYIAVE